MTKFYMMRLNKFLTTNAGTLCGPAYRNKKDCLNGKQSLETVIFNQPDSEIVAAMLEAERIAKDPTVKGYTDLDELFADLKS